ncbi:MAG: hypothetical protein LUF34_01060, partial [Lachnospiraceae bacterium]|nr:hypothetical protein [Lachnospiraceae bacterium]
MSIFLWLKTCSFGVDTDDKRNIIVPAEKVAGETVANETAGGGELHPVLCEVLTDVLLSLNKGEAWDYLLNHTN